MMIRCLRQKFLAFALLTGIAPIAAAQPEVDFRYRPFHTETAIGLPYDWIKTTVNQDAGLTYGYAPGPYATPLTEVYLRSANESYKTITVEWSRDVYGAIAADLAATQSSNRLALLLARMMDPAADLKMFPGGLKAVNPVREGQPSFAFFEEGKSEPTHRRRETWFNHVLGWAEPPAGTDPSFRNVAWGPNRAITYEIAVPKGEKRRIALGWADSRYDEAGLRAIVAKVEGAADQEVDPSGEAGKNGPVVRFFDAADTDGDGWIRIEAHPSPNSHDPNVILNTIWMFPAGTTVSAEDVIRGTARSRAERIISGGEDLHRSAPGQTDVIYGRFREADVAEVFVKTPRDLEWNEADGALYLFGKPMISTVPKALSSRKTEDGYVLRLPAGLEFVVAVHHGKDPVRVHQISDLNDGFAALAEYWYNHHTQFPVPYTVPDPGIQEVIETNWDNLYRMSDRVEGHHIFHTGPSVYRSIWTVDATMLFQSALFAGDSTNAREYIENIGRFQKASGQVEIMVPHILYRETAHYLQQLVMFAEMTGDDAWLKARWEQVQRGVDFLKTSRESTLSEPDAVYYGLFPPGFSDGGIAGGGAEYGSVYYTLVTMNYVLRTAQRFGWYDEPEVAEWRRFYAGLRASLVKAMQRDVRTDNEGNHFLPMRVGETDPDVRPTLAQWAFMESINYAELFGRGDSLAEGILNIHTTHIDQGLAVGTGWIAEALWPWYSMIQGVSHVQMDQPDRAAQLLYDITNHAGELGTWVEEQLPRHEGTRTGGDQSNASGSALYLNLIRRMLVNERSDGLHLLPAAPEYWFRPGDEIRVERTLTDYGPLHLTVKTDASGSSVRIHWDLELRDGVTAPNIHLHTAAINAAGFRTEMGAVPGVRGDVVFRR